MFSGRILWLAGVLALGIGCGQSAPPATKSTVPTLLGKTAPKLLGAMTWLNSAEVSPSTLSGKVVVLEFFDYSCVNCIRTYPYLLEWNRRYASLGVQVLGVHSPQYEFTMDPANVRASAKRYGLVYPIAVDSELKIAEAYQNRFWPRILVIDRDGVVRFDHTGEGEYTEAERQIQSLIQKTNPTAKLPDILPPVHDFDLPNAVCYPITPELYVGKARGNLANPEASDTNAVVHFRLPTERVEGKIYAEGDWSVHHEYMRHAADEEDLSDALMLKYRATEFNIVMKPESIYWMQVFVELDGKPLSRDIAGTDILFDKEGRSFVKVDDARMYNITNKQPFGLYEARLSVRGKGLSVYSFSFGTCAMPKGGDTLKAPKEAS